MATARTGTVGDLQPCSVESINHVVERRISALDDDFREVTSEDACNPVRKVLP